MRAPSTPSSEPEGAGQALRDQPEDGRKVEEAGFGRGRSDWPEGAEIDRAFRGGRGGHRRLPTLYAATVGRLSLCVAADNPAPDAILSAPLPQRHGIGRLPDVEGDKPAKRKFKSYPIGYFHIDIAEVRTEQGKLHMFVAIDRTSKFAFVELHEKATTAVSREFLLRLIEAVPYKIHTVLTDNGIQFTTPGASGSAVPLIREAIANGELFRAHAFEYACATNDIEHRTTKAKHPWTNGQVERMNRTIKDATVKRFYYQSHDQLRRHLADFVTAYNFGRRLKTLKGLTPYEFICKAWLSQPERFSLNPVQQCRDFSIRRVEVNRFQASSTTGI